MMMQGYTKAGAVVQSDTVNLTPDFTVKALYVGGAGAANIKMLTAGGSTVIFTNVQPGTVLPVVPKRIFDTLTTFADADMLLLGD